MEVLITTSETKKIFFIESQLLWGRL